MTRRPAYALQGDLAVFPPPLLFQMLQLGGLGGLLVLRAPDATCHVWFHDGQLVFARGPRQSATLGDELVARGLLDRDAVEEAARERRARRNGPRIGTILVEKGHIQRSELEAAIRERIKSVIFDIVDWRQGRFSFEAGVEARDEDILLDVGLESLLLECMTRLDDARRSQAAKPQSRAS